MPLPFDATLKEIAAHEPRAFLRVLGTATRRPVALLNVDLSTVTSAADLVFGIGKPLVEIIHVDCQASADADKHRDMLAYNALLHRRYRVPVHGIVLLLRPQAQHRNMDGTVRYTTAAGRGKMDFSYEVVRLWEQPVEELLVGTLAMLPLAVLGKLPEGMEAQDAVKAVVDRMVERLQAEGSVRQFRQLTASALVLTGLRLPREQGLAIFQGIPGMQESTTYQAILEEGEVRGLKRAILLQGQLRFGKPDHATRTAIETLTEIKPLERLVKRLPQVTGWQELLQTS